ncbi:MAG: PQ-loop repeat-containing protein, partial [Candidatus Dependentiae bacterium]
PDKQERWGVSITTVLILCAWLAAFVYGYSAGQEQLVGDICGWLLFCIATCIQAPQIYWNWRRQSVHAYSIHYVLFSIGAIAVDFSFAHILGVPLQTYFVYTGALIYRGVEMIQFWLYPYDDDQVALDDRLYTG